ncbi:MAG: head GIN domain-containing protein [Rikenellaceae bacterium]|jgi:hypothetical protein|nr:DUF2807 domain-containing protein [Bacteroidales bacterium]
MKKIFYLTVALIIIVLSSCSFPGMVSVRPEGEYISKDINPESFSSVSVASGFQLFLTQDSVQSMSVETYKNIFQYLEIEIVDSTLFISTKEGVNFSGQPNVKIHITTPVLDELSLSGGSRAEFVNEWKGENIDVSLSGGSRIYGLINVKFLEMDLSGGSRSELRGVVDYISVSSSGGSKSRHLDMQARKCNASISGGGSLEISVSDSLEIDCSGGSRVHYKGSPVISSELSGGSDLEKVD